MKLRLLPAFLAVTLAFAAQVSLQAADAPKPLKILLITGGCCHDYAKQKDILKAGLEARANVIVEHVHSDDKTVKPPLSIYGNPDYAKGYDLIIHDECAAGINDQAVVEAVLAPHRAGIPGVNLHCAMHSYRIGNPSQAVTELGTPHGFWFEYLGLQSASHGPQEPIKISYTDKGSPITKGLSDWTTVKEELYNNIKVFETARALASGQQTAKLKKKEADGTETVTEKTSDFVVAWTNTYMGKTRVFSTTIGHHNETVADARYLDLVTNGVLWATDKLGEDGKPKAGYGPVKK
jgi:type 1 glutamine amidotransferase